MNLLTKALSVFSNPGMFSAYVRWVTTKILDGKLPRLFFPGGEGESIGEWLSFSEFWSFQNLMPDSERCLIDQCLSEQPVENGVTIDIGANIGVFTCYIAAKGRTVHSFEPISETFSRLKSNVEFNDQHDAVKLNCLAVGEEEGLVAFDVQDDAPATNRMALPNEHSAANAADARMIPVVSLDTYCAEQGIERIAFLKIDVEGMEPFVIRGARNLLNQKKITVVLIEVCPVNLGSVGLSCADLYREIEEVHYSPYLLCDDGSPGERISIRDMEAMSLNNIVLLPDA